MKFRLLVLGAALMVTGCATTCDPSQGGFISGVNGLVSNCYNQNVDNEQAQLNQLRAAQAAAQQQAQTANQNVASQQAQLDHLRNNVAGLDRKLAAMRARIAHLKTQNSTQAANIADLRDEIDLQNNQLAQLNAKLQAGGGDYEAQEQQYEELKRAIQAEAVQLKQDEGQ